MVTETENVIPDWGELVSKSNEILELDKIKGSLGVLIKKTEADVVLKSMLDSSHFVNGKIPSMDFVKSTYMYTGFNSELLVLREQLAEITAELNRAEREFDIMKIRIDLYRTESANQRRSLL
jgi:hypothetical protein